MALSDRNSFGFKGVYFPSSEGQVRSFRENFLFEESHGFEKV